MATVQCFVDLKTWQQARLLSIDIDQLIKNNDYTQDLNLKRQMKSSSGSVMDNIAEGFERGGNKEFIQFLYIPKGSCGELISQLYRSFDWKIISKSDMDTYTNKAKMLSSMIHSFIRYLKNSPIKGDKYLLEEPISEYEITLNSQQ